MNEIIGYGCIGIVAGVVSGLLGIGGAVLIIPSLVFFFGYSQKMAQGTTLLLMIPPIGLLAALEYHRAGFTNIRAAVLIAVFFFIGGMIGGRFAIGLNDTVVRRVFAVFLVAIAVRYWFE